VRDTASTRFGTVALAGRPNAGKSSLLNALVGEPLAIVSPKPQSTRRPVVGLHTNGRVQLAFVDPAGLLDPRYALQRAMLAEAIAALDHANAILYLHPVLDGAAPPLPDLIGGGWRPRAPVLTVLTKADLLPTPPPWAGAGHVAASAVTRQGIETVIAWCAAHAPIRPFRYPADDLSTQPVRFFVAEFVREAAFAHLGDEVPYALAAEVDEFREGSIPVYIRVVLYTERKSQAGIVIGQGGRTIRAIGTDARRRVETFLGTAVYLELWVKTLPKWRSRVGALRRFGFEVHPERFP
jgi:GTP-binding protein Era